MKCTSRIPIARAAFSALLWAGAANPAPAQRAARPPGRSRAALVRHYDTSNATVRLQDLHSPGVGKDGIPALTDPPFEPVSTARFPPDDARVAVVDEAGETVAYPLLILNFHEVVNHTLGGRPIAVFYCPLCDSVSVVDRRLPANGPPRNGEVDVVLEFGVSGLLMNSNVVLYDRQTLGLWSQVYARAITGPHAGATLRHLPFRMMTFGDYRERYPDGRVLSRETGHTRPYARNPYASYFSSGRVFHRFRYGPSLPPKTLGLGLHEDGRAVFITQRRARAEPIRVDMPSGIVRIEADEAGFALGELPETVQAVQTFYHSWSAFFPSTEVLAAPGEGPGQ